MLHCSMEAFGRCSNLIFEELEGDGPCGDHFCWLLSRCCFLARMLGRLMRPGSAEASVVSGMRIIRGPCQISRQGGVRRNHLLAITFSANLQRVGRRSVRRSTFGPAKYFYCSLERLKFFLRFLILNPLSPAGLRCTRKAAGSAICEIERAKEENIPDSAAQILGDGYVNLTCA